MAWNCRTSGMGNLRSLKIFSEITVTSTPVLVLKVISCDSMYSFTNQAVS